MLKHASNASSAAATATGTAIAVPVSVPVPPTASASGGAPLGGGQLLRTASVIVANSSSSSSNNINCNGTGNGNSNSNSNSSGHNTPPVGMAGTGGGAAAGASAGTGTTTITNNGGGGGSSPTPAAAAVASTARNIHLRPPQPQPLNISALNASVASAGTSTLLNGGARVANGSTLLNIATPSTPLKPLTPLTPLTPNGHCLGNGSVHHHTYTNQHILASSQQQQQHHHHHHHQQSMQQPMHQYHHPSQPQSQQQSQQQQQQAHVSMQMPQSRSQMPHNYSHCNNLTANSMLHKLAKPGPSPREALTSLGLLCLISLLLALLSLIFLLRISPTGREDAIGRGGPSSEDFILVYDVTLALGALSLSLNLCCLLVCAIQFLFAVKLRAPAFEGRDNQYLAKSSVSRTCAVSGFFISIPVFLTGLILYTFSHFHSTPAIVTSVLIGVGIVFCGGAMVHNVFVWQREKTISYRSAPLGLSQLLTPPLPPAGPLTHNLSLLSAAQLPPVPLPVPVPLPLPLPPVNAYQSMQQQQQPQQLYQGHHACLLQPPSVTPVSPNHSHGSFNPLLSSNLLTSGVGGAVNSSFLVRPATATPPTPKPGNSSLTAAAAAGRDACGSVSPGIPPTLDMSNMTISLHELSTLV